METLRMEVASQGITVAMIDPGAILTPLFIKSGEQHRHRAATVRRHLPAHRTVPYDALLRHLDRFGGAQVALQDHNGQLGLFDRRPWERALIATPRETTRAIRHALTSSTPLSRYIVGLDGKMLAFLRAILPDALFDAVLWKSLQAVK